MNRHFASKTLIALAVAIAAAAGYETLANEQPMPPPASTGALPANITPGTPVAEVVKLAQAGVEISVIQNYITSCSSPFNLGADQIISLTDAGVTSDMVNAMINHDKNLTAALPPPTAPGPEATEDVSSAPPTTVMSPDDFNNTLTPYGQWVQVEGYGRCWRPTVVVYDSTWQPYCDHGSWVYTDCGWYWNSDYSWGVAFHYGRWFHHDHYGWCWWPDTVWAPSWVTWRSSGDYCGWAPLPPYTAYQPGIGFMYRGANVSVGFNFGLAANCFTFVSVGHFCDPHPRNYCVPHQQVPQIYNQTTIINNYNSHNHTIVNNGVSVTVIGAATHRPIQPVSVGSLHNAGQHGWPGAGEPNRNGSDNHTDNHPGGGSFNHPGNTGGGGNPQPTHNPNPGQFNGNGGDQYNHQNHGNTGNTTSSGTGHRPPFNPPSTSGNPGNHSGGTTPSPGHYQNPGTPSNPPSQPHQPGSSGRNYNNNAPAQNSTVPAMNNPQHASAPAHPGWQPNYTTPAPRTPTPSAPVAASPGQNAPPNSGGKSQGWAWQNH